MKEAERRYAMRALECYIMIGPLGVGKTTYAKAFARERALAYLCPDDHWDRLQISHYSDEISIPVWGHLYDQIYQCIRRSENFILDSAQSTRGSRREVAGVIRSMSRGRCKITAIHLESSLEQCLRGARSRPDRVPPEMVREYYEMLQKEPPALADGYDELIVVRRDEHER